MSAFDIFGDGFVMLKEPTPNWEVCIGGDWTFRYTIYLERGPNWFHRLMQRLILGLHWRKV